MKKILFRLVALLIGSGVILISLECFLRLNPKFGYNYNSYKVDARNQTLYEFNEDLNRDPRHIGRYRPSSLLGYEHMPNSRPEINAYGLIGKEYKLKKDKNTFRILLLGDSIAEQGWSAEFLEEELNKNPQLGSKYKFEIWNAGVPSYDVRRYALYLQHKGLSYKPGMVLIFMFMNDFNLNINLYYKNKSNITCSYYSPLKEVSKIYNVNPFFMKHLYVYRFMMLRMEGYLSAKQKKQGIDPEEQNGRYYITKIMEMCDKNNIPLFIVIFLYLKPLGEYNNYQKHEYQTINSVVKSFTSNYINLYDKFPESDLYNLRLFKQEEIHPSPEGHALIAEIIYNYLIKNFSFVKNGGV